MFIGNMSGNKKQMADIMTSGTGDVEALNKILNNINVQTKKNDNYQQNLIDGKLPRKILINLNLNCNH